LNTQERLEAAYRENPSIGRKLLAKAAKCSLGPAQRFLEKKRGIKPKTKAKPKTEHKDEVNTSFNKDAAEVTVNSLRVISLDDALRVSKVDLALWEVDRYVVNAWEVTIKGDDGPEQATNHQVKVWLKRLHPAITAFSRLIEQVESRPACARDHAPLPELVDPHMLEISLMDHHFGKLAWRGETGDDYDLKIAQRIYQAAVRDLLARAKGYNIGKILFPVGQDFFNIDNNANTTTGGTAQDSDGRLAKIFEVGCNAVIDAIDYCSQVAEVEVIYVPGNHDYTTSYYLVKYLQAWYRNCERVSINAVPTSRKYIKYGVNLLGFSHGCDEKRDSLPLIMLSECRDMIQDVKHFEFHTGHLHMKRETKYVAGDSFGPVIVRILPSLCGTDAYHYKHGYIGGNKSAEAYLWSEFQGFIAYFNTYASKEGL